MNTAQPTNRLARETSPYLLQHARNPVDWYPWGPEALQRARAERRPIFLSIGYSACHWCHVMERESFENDAISTQLNASFVCIKVDREERPDIDEIYMKAVQAMTGSGGWPMSVFLTPELEPFYGGTYFPPRSAYGRPGFSELLTALSKAWRDNQGELVRRAATMARHIAEEGRAVASGDLAPNVLDGSLTALEQSFDPHYGGFGGAPKFPHALDLRLLLRHGARRAVELASEGAAGASRDLASNAAIRMATSTLDHMAAGGIHDQLGGGFHRYSTDERWLIPHFEKMLYDNALLVPAYLEAFLVTGEVRHAEVARRACDWVLREMTTPTGGFASSQDADSEGVEGKFFAWTPRELEAVLGARLGRITAAWFGVTDEGNFEHGTSALWRPESAEKIARDVGMRVDELEHEMRAARDRLLEVRSRRVPPGTDDKVLAAWNGLMISALARAHQVLDEPRYLAAARGAARYVLEGMRRPDGRLLATARGGRAHLDAYLDDHAFMIQGLIDLYESDFDPRWIHEALALNDVLEAHFTDTEQGGYFTTADDHEKLIARLKAPHDGALPSGNGVQALNLLRLAELTGREQLARRAEATIRSVAALVNRYPAAFSQMLIAADFLASGPREIVVSGELEAADTRALLATLRGMFLPACVVALADARRDEVLMPIVREKASKTAGARAFVCRNYACAAPASDVAQLKRELAAHV